MVALDGVVPPQGVRSADERARSSCTGGTARLETNTPRCITQCS